jgi:hypothetical protein
MPRNIVVCCDGTGNEYGSANSNVVKLYWTLSAENKQIGYYHPGVGTMGGEKCPECGWKVVDTDEGAGVRLWFLRQVADASFAGMRGWPRDTAIRLTAFP